MSTQAAAVIITAILTLGAILWIAAWSSVRNTQTAASASDARQGYERAKEELELARRELEARIEQSQYDRP